MQALLDAGLPVSAVISNVPGAAGLAIAAKRGVPTGVVPHRDFASRECDRVKIKTRPNKAHPIEE